MLKIFKGIDPLALWGLLTETWGTVLIIASVYRPGWTLFFIGAATSFLGACQFIHGERRSNGQS